ncbi:GL12877 [Drosophila persimilis]|uniref:GL12877 n=1 Tax=Drosophila persimilis TaxID=7234 RepID=B4GVA5_DROPE|nr:GL12877 [Drosophila persimilis]
MPNSTFLATCTVLPHCAAALPQTINFWQQTSTTSVKAAAAAATAAAAAAASEDGERDGNADADADADGDCDAALAHHLQSTCVRLTVKHCATVQQQEQVAPHPKHLQQPAP